jgi:hypothetical protein
MGFILCPAGANAAYKRAFLWGVTWYAFLLVNAGKGFILMCGCKQLVKNATSRPPNYPHLAWVRGENDCARGGLWYAALKSKQQAEVCYKTQVASTNKEKLCVI